MFLFRNRKTRNMFAKYGLGGSGLDQKLRWPNLRLDLMPSDFVFWNSNFFFKKLVMLQFFHFDLHIVCKLINSILTFGIDFKITSFSEQQQQQQIWKKDFCLCVCKKMIELNYDHNPKDLVFFLFFFFYLLYKFTRRVNNTTDVWSFLILLV